MAITLHTLSFESYARHRTGRTKARQPSGPEHCKQCWHAVDWQSASPRAHPSVTTRPSGPVWLHCLNDTQRLRLLRPSAQQLPPPHGGQPMACLDEARLRAHHHWLFMAGDVQDGILTTCAQTIPNSSDMLKRGSGLSGSERKTVQCFNPLVLRYLAHPRWSQADARGLGFALDPRERFREPVPAGS